MIDLSISIVNYNTVNLLKQCLLSIYKETKGINLDIWVVDNASSDESIQMIKTNFPEVNLIVNKENLFFTKAHNQALKLARGRYLVLLNPDTILLNNAFKIMTDFMDKHPETGACGPKLLNPDMTDQGSGLAFPSYLYGLFEVLCINALFPYNLVKNKTWVRGWDRNDLREVHTVGGACMLVRREISETVGLLDENFLAFWEETDWCLRIKKAGWKIYFIPEAKVIHIEKQSIKQIGRRKEEKIFRQSMLYYYKKHYGIMAWLSLKFFVVSLSPLILLKRKLFK